MRGTRTRIDLPHRGFGKSLGEQLEVFSGEASAKQEGNWIEVEEKEPGVFAVMDDNMTVKGTARGFSQWDGEVEDLDAGDSDESQCFGMSSHLKWQDVDLTPEEFCAPSIERLKEALDHVAICAWDPEDI